MAHKKAGGASARQGSNIAGKRRGFKAFGGETVKPGQIIIRQLGQKFIPGENVGMGKDFTIFSKIIGKVAITYKDKKRKKISVLPL